MDQNPPANVTPLPRRRSRLWNEVKRHPYAYILTAVFAVAGAVLAPLLFPAATPAMGLFGGLALGIYAALCTVPNKFLG
jgi:hypothetical protein